jgi:PhnB protein
MTKPIPDEYPRVTPYLIVAGAAEAIDFYESVLGAAQRGERMTTPDGKVGHAELTLGDSLIMIADESHDWGAIGPVKGQATGVTIHVYVEDVDKAFAKAIDAGATEIQPVTDQFYGDRSGQFEDPWGHRWNIASHVEDVPPEEMAERAKAAMA